MPSHPLLFQNMPPCDDDVAMYPLLGRTMSKVVRLLIAISCGDRPLVLFLRNAAITHQMPNDFISQYTVLPKPAVLTCQQLQVDPYRIVTSSRIQNSVLNRSLLRLYFHIQDRLVLKTLTAFLTGVIHGSLPFHLWASRDTRRSILKEFSL